MANESVGTGRRITSVEIGRRARGLCWAFGLTLVAAGGVATFTSANQAGTTALILFGGLLLFIAITKRVPLLIEVGTAKLDTSYEAIDEAFEAGREAAMETTDSEPPTEDERGVDYARFVGQLYRGAVAARVAGITYRQLDYWARTELIVPSGLSSDDSDGPARRLYTAMDVVLLRVIKVLLDSGLSLQDIRNMVRTLEPLPISELEGLYLLHDRLGSRLVQAWNSDDAASPTVVVPVGAITSHTLRELASFA